MCLIGHDSGVLFISYIHIFFLFLYYGCQMAGLIKSRVYIYFILIWIVKCNILLYVMSVTHHCVYSIILCALQSWQMVWHGLPGLTVDAACHIAHLWASTQSNYCCIVLIINDTRHTRRSSSSILHLFGYTDLFRIDLMLGTHPCAIAYTSHFALGWARCSIAIVMILNLINRLYDG
jgi:hypothetical protein